MRLLISTLFIVLAGLCFGFNRERSQTFFNEKNSVVTEAVKPVSNEIKILKKDEPAPIVFSQVNPANYVAFAKTLVGTPYLYGSVDPSKGFDCSGFINYVSKHFGMKVPRSSVDFTNFGTSIDSDNAQPGDLILFTGTDASRRIVGHMGIITENDNGQIQFIHSSSGKGKGVIISDLEGYYETRFVKVIRIMDAAGV